MEKNERVSEETFGSPIPQIPVKKGTIHTFGHAINDSALPDRGVSVNVKTGFPVKGNA
jgi:hypothetical protein